MTKNQNILNKIKADDALVILKNLAMENPNIAKKIDQIAIKHLSSINPDDIASQVYFELDNISVEEVWDNSGSTSYGYVEPTDMAWEMFEEALEPFMEKMKNYQKLSMHAEVKMYCMGILKGIYKFENESTSEYKDWATDAPKNYFDNILDDWKKTCKSPKDEKEMEEFIKKTFPDW